METGCDELWSGNLEEHDTNIPHKVSLHLVFGFVVNGVLEIIADGDVDLEAAESPRDEDNRTVLDVEGKVFDVEWTVGGQQSRIHP